MSSTLFASVIPTIIAALLAAYTYRQSRVAKDKATVVSATRADVDAYDNARKTWESQVESLRSDVVSLSSKVRDLSGRVAVLEEEVRTKDQKLFAAYGYIQSLLRLVRIHALPNVPSVPIELSGEIM